MPSVVSLDLVQTVAKARLLEPIGALDDGQIRQLGTALNMALGCSAG